MESRQVRSGMEACARAARRAKAYTMPVVKSLILFVIDIFNLCSTSVQAGFDPNSKILHNSSASGWSRCLTVVLHLLLQESQDLRFVDVNLTFGSKHPKRKHPMDSNLGCRAHTYVLCPGWWRDFQTPCGISRWFHLLCAVGHCPAWTMKFWVGLDIVVEQNQHGISIRHRSTAHHWLSLPYHWHPRTNTVPAYPIWHSMHRSKWTWGPWDTSQTPP